MFFDFSDAQSNRYDIKIGDTVSDGVPGAGAGNIEQSGGLDIYTFSAAAGQQVFFDLLSVPDTLTFVHWKLLAPNGNEVFNRIFNCCGGSDPGVYTLTQGGTYTIRVGEDADPGTGAYSFKIWNVPPPNQFDIAVGSVVALNVPGEGAGNIETPGVKDVYTFSATAGQQVFFDLQNVATSLTYVHWRLVDPDNIVVFDRILNCCGGSDPGLFTLTKAGTYTITVGDNADAGTGTYGFKLTLQ